MPTPSAPCLSSPLNRPRCADEPDTVRSSETPRPQQPRVPDVEIRRVTELASRDGETESLGVEGVTLLSSRSIQNRDSEILRRERRVGIPESLDPVTSTAWGVESTTDSRRTRPRRTGPPTSRTHPSRDIRVLGHTSQHSHHWGGAYSWRETSRVPSGYTPDWPRKTSETVWER